MWMLIKAERQQLIEKLRLFPQELRQSVSILTEAQLTLRPDQASWSVAQIIHHLADSHIDVYIRCKLILTEERPLLKSYDQDQWAVLPGSAAPPIQSSLALLGGVHDRWCTLLEGLKDEEWLRVAPHVGIGEISIEDFVVSYLKHGVDHLAQIATILAGPLPNEAFGAGPPPLSHGRRDG